jgi:hypothetical protein
MNNLDNTFLHYFGGVETNSLRNILKIDTDINDDDEIHNEPNIIEHSSYYEFQDLTNLFNNKNGFSIFSTNAQFIYAKIDQLKIFIERLKHLGHAFSVICIQESWLTDNADTSQLQLEGYKMISQGHSCSTKGGLIIYLQEEYDYIYKNKLNKYESWEGQVIQIKKGNTLNKAINLVNIYRPPKDITEKYTEFIRELSPLLKTLESGNNEAIITGDFNIDLLKINEKQVFSEYFDTLTSHSFYPKITLPTRLSNNHGTLIDNIICKLTENTLNLSSGILIDKFSDHQPYFTILKNIKNKNHVPKFVEIHKQDPESLLKFQNDIAASLMEQITNSDPKQDPNINYNKLHNTVQLFKEKHMPVKCELYNKHKHKKSSWITHGIIHSINFRDKLHKIHKMTDPTSEEYEIQKTNLKTYNNILKQSIRLAKKTYYEQIFSKVKNYIKATWKTINGILNKTKRKKTFPKIFKHDGIVFTDKTDIANKFNTFFTNIGPKLSSQIQSPINKSYKMSCIG